jgi:hypothetical protein
MDLGETVPAHRPLTPLLLPAERRRLLGQCLSGDAELIDPTGRWQGIAGLSDRIGNYHSSAPGTTVVPASGVDVHNGIERYAWKIVDPSGIPPSTIRRARGCWTADDRTAADAFARVTSPEDCRQSKR